MTQRVKSLNDFLSLLKGVKKVSGGYMALCPAHDDHEQSLSVKQNNDRILIYCHAGCSADNILETFGLTKADLFLGERPLRTNRRKKPKPEHREIEAIYNYVDANDKPFQVVRTKPKGFFQRRPDGRGGYINNLNGIEPTLYRQDELEFAMYLEEEIYIVEGEKDVDNLREHGFTATTNPGGAGKWSDKYSDKLRGGDLIIIPDNDRAGYNHARRVAHSCYGKAARLRLLELPEASDISDWLDQGHTAEELKQLVAQCPNYKILPTIICNNRHLREKTHDALQALYQANNPAKIFYRGGILCRIGKDELQRPIIEMLAEAALRGHMERSADFITVNAKGEVSAISPPLDVVRDVASLGDWQFPVLMGITEAPVMRQDGTVLDTPGYDPNTQLSYMPMPGLTVPPISENPTTDEVKKAAEQVFEIICDFPFVDKSSYANTVATIILPVIKPLVSLAPMAVFDKPQPGTGASLIADVISIIATGRPAATMGVPRSEEECEKKLNSHLLDGRTICVIDNVDTKLWSDTLARFLTSHYISIRPLGRSADIRLENNLIYIMTGNNIQLGGDLPRRCFWVRLDAQIARPWLRENFKHPRLLAWVSENRGTILAAILTIARAWVVAGRPTRQTLPPLGSYEEFAKVVSGILDFVGVEGFLENLIAMYDTMDKDTPQWECFLATWRDFMGDTPLTVRELIQKFEEFEDLANSLPDKLVARNDERKESYNRRLGNALAKRVEVRHPNGLVLKKAGASHRAITWKVEVANSPESIAKSELGEFLPRHLQMKNNKENNNNIYIKKEGKNSPNSLLKLKSGELTHSAGKAPILLPDGRVLDWQWCLSTFTKLGHPCMVEIQEYDISVYLYPEKLSPKKLQQIVDWLEEHSGQQMGTKVTKGNHFTESSLIRENKKTLLQNASENVTNVTDGTEEQLESKGEITSPTSPPAIKQGEVALGDKPISKNNTSFVCPNCKGRRYWVEHGKVKKCAECWTPPEGTRIFEDD